MTCDVPWLYGAIIRDSVRLIVAPLEPDSKQSGSARIDNQDGTVTVSVDAYTQPLPRIPRLTAPTWRDEVRDGVAAAIFIVLIFGGIALLVFFISLV